MKVIKIKFQIWIKSKNYDFNKNLNNSDSKKINSHHLENHYLIFSYLFFTFTNYSHIFSKSNKTWEKKIFGYQAVNFWKFDNRIKIRMFSPRIPFFSGKKLIQSRTPTRLVLEKFPPDLEIPVPLEFRKNPKINYTPLGINYHSR